MSGATTIDPVAIIRAEARLERGRPMPTRLWRRLSGILLDRLDQRVTRDVSWLQHEGVLEDFRRASGG